MASQYRDGQIPEIKIIEVGRKHVNIACDACRTRHLKCSGDTPSCRSCVRNSRDCVYRSTNQACRQFLKYVPPSDTPKNIQAPTPPASENSVSSERCSSSELSTASGYRKRSNTLTQCLPNTQQEDDCASSLSDYLRQAENCQEYDLETRLLDPYYNTFHHCHPILPPQESVLSYFKSLKDSFDLQEAIRLVNTVCTTETPLDAESLSEMITIVSDRIQNAPDDIVKLQSLILITIASHLTNMPSVSVKSLSYSVDLCLRFQAIFSQTDNKSPLLSSSYRTELVEPSVMFECFQRAFQEIFYLDVMLGAASKLRRSKLATLSFQQMVEASCLRGSACWTRFKATEITAQVVAFFHGNDNKSSSFMLKFEHLQALVTTWQSYVSDPTLIGAPNLVDHNGVVNDAIMQATLGLNYSAILLNLPFSTLYASRIPSHVDCTQQSTTFVKSPFSQPNLARRIVSTRKCLEAADAITQIASDLGIPCVLRHTPLYICAITMALLIHIKGYHWLANSDDIDMGQMSRYEIFVQLEAAVLDAFGKRWLIARLLLAKLKSLMKEFVPTLNSKVFYLDDDNFAQKTSGIGSNADPLFIENCKILSDLGMDFFDDFISYDMQ